MSIKTSKRIALGVIASLVFAPFAAIAPASANTAATATFTTTAGATKFNDSKPTSRPNVAGVYDASFTVGTVAATGNGATTVTLHVRSVISAKPAGSSATITNGTPTGAAFTTATAGSVTSGLGTGLLTFTTTTATVTAAAGTLVVPVTLNPDVAGSYTIVTWNDQDQNGAIDTGEAFTTKTITIAAEATALSLTALNASGATSSAGTANSGALVKISLTNGDIPTSLAGTEVLTVALSGNTGTSRIQTAPGGSTAVSTLNRNSFDSDGNAYLNVTNTTASTGVLTVSGTIGGVALAKTVSLTWEVPTTNTNLEATTKVTNLTGVVATTAANAAGTGAVTGNVFVDSAKNTTISYSFTGSTTTSTVLYEPGEFLEVKVTDGSDGVLLGKSGLAYTTTVKFGTTAVATFSIPVRSASATYATAPAIGAPITVGTVLFSPNTANTQTIKVVPAGNNSMAIAQSTFRVANGGTVSASLTVKDQFGIARALQPITVSLNAGSRNSGAAGGATKYLITDANGVASWTYTDGPLTANATLVSDTWTVASTGTNANSLTNNGGTYADNSSAVTVTFVAEITVGTVKIDTPDTTAGVANVVKATPSPIGAGASGASAAGVSISATVTDANGSVYSGIPVVFSVQGTGAAIFSDKVTVYTNNAGVATSSIYAWKTGTYTITATSGGKTSTGTISFASTTAENARIVSATVNGNVVTGKVVDRYGNPVSGVTLYATTTSPANIGGVFTKDVATGNDGTASWVISGFGSVTVSAVNPTSPAGTTFGQTCAAVGFVSCAATAKALEAPVAGTSLVAEKNIGNDLAPAGVASATVTIAAPPVVVPEVVYDKPTLSIVQSGGRIFLSGTAEEGEGDIIIYVKRVGTTAWKERAKTLEVAAPGDFNGSIKAPRGNVVIRVKQEGTGLFSNQVIIVK